MANKEECCIEALQKRMNSFEKSFVKVFELEQKSDAAIYKEYKYKTWDSLEPVVFSYFQARYNIYIPCGITPSIYLKGEKCISTSECIGEFFERYHLQEAATSKLKKQLADFTSAQLSEVVEAVIEVLNKKKEEEYAKKETKSV